MVHPQDFLDVRAVEVYFGLGREGVPCGEPEHIPANWPLSYVSVRRSTLEGFTRDAHTIEDTIVVEARVYYARRLVDHLPYVA